MTRENNIFLAKRILVDSVYAQANLEGIAVTFAQTQDILNNVNAANLKPVEISKICCLRDGWKYLFDGIGKPLDLVFLEEMHEIVARFDVSYQYLGKLRDEDVIISGTKWRPELPNIDVLDSFLKRRKSDISDTDYAIRVGLSIMRMQPFKDGNKRIGSFSINKVLIENGRGIFNVPVKLDGTFKQKLVDFYESDNLDEISKWIIDNCIEGV